MAFNDQGKFDNEAAGQTFPTNYPVDETDEWEVWLGTASKNHWNCPDNNYPYPVSCVKQIQGLPRYHKWSQDISKQSKM